MLRTALLATATLSLASFASAQCSTVTATNNAGEITIDLDGSDAMRFAFIVLGDTLGNTPVSIGNLVSFDLGLAAPFVPAPLGLTDMNGDASLTFTPPTTAPAGTYYVQGLTAGFAIVPGTGISFDVCVSDVASFTL